MREHEVPTHVQAEDKVLLWFTFPQIVAVVAVCAVAYGAYHYFPFGPTEFRLGMAILLGVVGIAMTVGKVGGRGLPLVAADLLKFNLGARRYAGSPAQLVITEAPAPAEAKPDPLRLLAKKAASGVSRAVKAARRKGRPPFRPHSWFGKGRRQQGRKRQRQPSQHSERRRQAEEALEPPPGGGRRSGCWPWSCCPAPFWPTTPTTRSRAGGWTKSTSCRRTRCRDGASSSSASPSPATPPTSPCGRPTTWT